MESLLSLAFDNLSSRDGGKVRKGLRQVEGLLAQICLSKNKISAAEKRRSLASPISTVTPRKDLGSLKDDPAFREFFKLQEGFEWNGWLIPESCRSRYVDRLLGKGSNGQNDLLIISTLNVIQGILLLHPPSRVLFSKEYYINPLLDLLEPENCPAVQSATIQTLLTALIDQPANMRVFEALDGLLIITSVYKQRSTSREVRLRLMEFIYFYLMPETPSIASANAPHTPLKRSPSKLAGAFGRSVGGMRSPEQLETRSTGEKQAMLGRYLSNVDDIVADMRDNEPFRLGLA